MSRFKLLGFAAISWLPLVSLVGSAQASELFDAASRLEGYLCQHCSRHRRLSCHVG